ncbi:hypothetical protein RJ639_019960 [Escallonia herrerae]|uniref:Isopenicillin N synthase-like Fe(2+) 2OG dioxygenase domain-containing protein n=1 Tax=Escallonia herrerae TaxID=1293975 RepID=A0AA89AIB9_9ASTE|nr:hypothetical protein RJ639_019960 [Escallonia herrerae]
MQLLLALDDKLPLELYNATLDWLRKLFDPLMETKMKNTYDKPYYSYIGQQAFIPLFESMGIKDANNAEEIQCFANLMWPPETTTSGEWMPVEFPPSSFVAMAGEALLRWSSGRVRSPFHRVIMSGNEERYSLGSSTFINGTTDVSEELVDHKHPRQFKPFDHLGFVDFCVENSCG